MSDEKKQLNKARQALVDRMLSRLDAGAIPWDNGMKGFAAPRNAVSGKHYRGINLLNLMLAGKDDPRWLTFNQATDAGYKVKKGARGVPIELYKIIDKRTGKDADLVAIKEEIKDMTFAERQAFKKENLQTFARTYHVFNASDVIGIEPYRAPILTPEDISARNERIEAVIAGSQAPIFYDGNGRNFYRPATDEIHLTDRSSFKSDEFFYNTALHEMAHSTGHSSRLNRQGGTFGSKAYAREELVAEMASVLIAAELGLNHSKRVFDNSKEYIHGWAQLIRDNPQTLIDVAFDASKATDYICDYERQRAQKQEKTQKEVSDNEYRIISTIVGNVTANQKSVNVEWVSLASTESVETVLKIAEKYGCTVENGEMSIPNAMRQAYYAEWSRRNEQEKTQKESLQSGVKEWYSRTFPTDELASELNANATFGSVRDAIMSGKDVYTELGSYDSVVRERVFRQLADVLDLPYKSVYNAWIENSESAETRKERYERAMREDFPKDFADDIDEPTPAENSTRTTQTVQLRMTAAEQQVFKEFLTEWTDGANTERQVYDFGAGRPQSEDFWKGLAMLGEVERTDMSFGVRFDRERAHSFKIENDLYANVSTPQSAQTEQPKGKTQKESVQPAKQQPAPAATFKTNLDNIPAEMKALPNWVAFRTKTLDDGKVKKMLLSPNKGASSVEYLKWAKSNDPNTWATFDKAVEFAKKYQLDGVAFSLSGSGITCIDLDHHLDENGRPSELAQKFIDAAQGTYIEKSVSGKGLHIFYAGSSPEGRMSRNIGLDIESYDCDRFMSMTGNLYGNAPKEVAPPSAALKNVLSSYLAKIQQNSAPSAPLGMDDNALIDKIRSSSRRADFDALWRGELILTKGDGSGDPSRCDYMLCNILGFFSGGDVAQVERLIKSSGLYRPEKPDKYYAMTARKACDGLRKVYTPAPKSNGTKKNGWKLGGNGKPNGNGSGGNSGR